ncbi:hypothetical protein C9J27_04055 [Photobacterium kishitanii]|uniref:Uncharacterized protein n=1 Tax=Photobacterium kishitanii TaxID=318456 RepID=A0A2T3KKQ9_9GAMM|nr:hypothetical protein C9J27_04055 [Photobacterium kishitanii]
MEQIKQYMAEFKNLLNKQHNKNMPSLRDTLCVMYISHGYETIKFIKKVKFYGQLMSRAFFIIKMVFIYYNY